MRKNKTTPLKGKSSPCLAHIQVQILYTRTVTYAGGRTCTYPYSTPAQLKRLLARLVRLARLESQNDAREAQGEVVSEVEAIKALIAQFD